MKRSPKPRPRLTPPSLFNIAKIVAVATLIGKVFGLLRSTLMAAVFGVGTVANAYNYAYIIPGFSLTILGGINGPLHVSLVSVLSKRDKSEAASIVKNITTLVSGFLLLLTILLILFANNFIDLIAPGLQSPVRELAIAQLQIMAPVVLFAGLIGIGFGSLNAAQHYWLPSISPMFSSMTVMVGLGWFIWQGEEASSIQYLRMGSFVLATATLIGAIVQWLMQWFVQRREGMGGLIPSFNWNTPGVKEAVFIMIPAILSSSMGQINIYIDLYFASYIPGAAASLNYAGLLAQTPKGILSSILLIPLMPVFSHLATPEHWTALKQRIRQGLVLTALTMLPLGALMIALAVPIVKLVFERQAFDANASRLVASVVMAYGLGAFTSVAVSILVRVFYALEDGKTPFRITLLNILLNVVLDYLLIQSLGTPGLVLASMSLNISAMLIMLWCLHRRLDGLPWREWGTVLLGLVRSAGIAGLTAWGIGQGFALILGRDRILGLLLQLVLAGSTGLGVFAILVSWMKLPEVELLLSRFRKKNISG
ncbi:MAG: murein biosynthesis integral membrane protein MurJ [Cyanobacteria bacterium P01_A01_bin.84]